MAARPRRSPGRWLAPLALVTCAVAVYTVVNKTVGDQGGSTTNSLEQRATPSRSAEGTSAKKTRRRFYRVKAGDTLSAISLKTGVSLTTIERLNPKLDADTLHAGQRVRLAR
jgi:LysM repeat protein